MGCVPAAALGSFASRLRVNGAVLTISAWPQLLDRQGQSWRAVGNDEPWRGEPAGRQVAAELEPGRFGLACPETYRDQRAGAVFGEPPGAHRSLLRAEGADRQVDRVE